MTFLDVLVRQDKERLIYRILLQIFDFLTENFHHTVRQVTIQDVAGRQLDVDQYILLF